MSPLQPYDLRVDGQATPGGVVRPPRFAWRWRSDEPNARQVAYRLQVRQQVAGGGSVQVWDTGRVESSDPLAATYRGAPLHTSTGYEWTLNVEGADGRTATADSRFATGIVHLDEWTAVWIGRDPSLGRSAVPPQDSDLSYTVNKLQPVRRLAHSFHLDELPARAAVHASAHGSYRLYLNGHRVGRDELAPGWTEYHQRVTYQSWEVTDLLVPGENRLAALLGDGWYAGFIGTDRRHQAQHYGTDTAFLAQLVIDQPDGGRRIVATDETWRADESDIRYADLLMGQYEDSRLAEPGWTAAGFDLSAWPRAVVADRDCSRLVPETDPGVRAMLELAPVGIVAKGGGRHIVDFGQNLVGRVRITLRALDAGTRVQLNHAEVLDGGELYTANLRTAEPVDVFWTNGDAEQVFEPRFTLHGFRYVEVQGVPGELAADDLRAVVLHSGFDLVSSFTSSDPAVDRLFANIQWGLRGNFVSIPTDCPQRDERLGWLADAQVFAPTALALADTAPLLTRWLRDVRGAQRPDGAFPDIAPLLIHRREGAPAWGDGGVTIPWAVYRATGDPTVLAEAADSMVAWVRHIERHNPDLIWRNAVGNNYGDWLQLGEQTPREVVATAYFAHSCDLTARTLQVLGRHAEAAAIAGLAARVRDAFSAAFLDCDGSVTDDTQGGYLLTLAFGLCPEPLRELAAARLVAAVERRDRCLTTGFITVGLLCPVLSRIGRDDLAFAVLHNDRYPSWLFSVRNGATTIWERWDGWTPERGFQSPRMNSFNHFSLGSVGQWFISGILGIGQAASSAGYRDLELAPLFDPHLDHASGHLETPRGRVASSWRRTTAGIDWQLTVPPGNPAEVVLRHTRAVTLKEGGEIKTPSGVHSIGESHGPVRFTAGPGTFDFRILPE